MPDLTVVIPSRGRPDAISAMAETFDETCTADTRIVVAVDSDDPKVEDYARLRQGARPSRIAYLIEQPKGTMVTALNLAARAEAKFVFAVGFMGDDHRPRSRGWDTAYLEALSELRTGIVYGDDLLQRRKLPTQCAMTADIVRALGYMAPPVLTHLFVDNFWLSLGEQAQCIRYLSEVVVEHLHPVAGKAAWDEGYKRVNDAGMYHRDHAAFAEYCRTTLQSDVQKVQALQAVGRAEESPCSR